MGRILTLAAVLATAFSRHGIAILLILVPVCALSQIAEPRTPIGYLSRVAGLYVGANEYMLAFARSKCGYVFRKKAPSTDSLIRTELLPAFPSTAHEEVVRVFTALQPQAKVKGDEMVRQTIEATLKEHKGDERMACGFAAGMAAGTHAGAAMRWQAEVMRFRQSDK
jgi:hypothetical protein